MTRPLFYKTSRELGEMVERNLTSRAELELVLAELRHREAATSKRLEKKVRARLKSLSGGEPRKKEAPPTTPRKSPTSSSKSASKGASRSRVGVRFATLEQRAKADWSDPKALQKHLQSAHAFSGENAENLATSIAQRIRELVARQEESPMAQTATQRASGSSPSDDERRWTDEAVADLRKKLIDLSKRNPLVNFKHTSRGASHLRFVDERPDLVFEHLRNGSVGFEPLPDEDVTPPDEETADFQIAYERARLTDEEYLAATDKIDESDARGLQEAERQLRAKVRKQLGLPFIQYGKALDVKALAIAHGFDPSFELKNSDDGDTEEHHEDDKVRVLLTRKVLEKRLKTIWDRYRSHARETGLHTLFLVLGFVQWYEDDASDVPLQAPLLLLPVGLERKARYGRYEYRLTGTDEDPQVNIALGEKLKQLGIELPALRDGETPESYFIRVAGVLEKGHRLSLRRFATLAVLPFPRMVLWRDLDPANWEEGAFAEHPLLPVLVRAKGTDGPAMMGENHDIDDPEFASKAPPLIQPADASQHSALIDVVEGKSVAIEGPPGTGKSQTITNMIAAALREGKRVLFVAEKQAALKVVADRLRHVGLGPLLLELHSDSTDRTSFYESIRQRLAAKVKVDEAELNASKRQLEQQRDLIRRYLSLIGTQLGARRKSAHWLAWRQITLQDRVPKPSLEAVGGRWQPQDPEAMDEVAIADGRAKLETFASALAAVDALESDQGRTLWAAANRLDPFNQESQLAVARDAAGMAARLSETGSAIESALDVSLPAPGGDVDGVLQQLQELVAFGVTDEAIVRAAVRGPETARAVLSRQARWRQICSRLDEDLIDPRTSDRESCERLANALAAHVEVPETVSEVADHLARVRAAIKNESKVLEDRRSLVRTVGFSDQILVEDLGALSCALVLLDEQNVTVKALYQPALLDELTMLATEEEKSTAAELIAEKRALSQLFKEAAFDHSPDELDRLANTFESAGLFARLIGGEYRAAKREAVRLFDTLPAERVEIGESLRRLSSNLRRRASFRKESTAAELFPPPLWKGADSDWNALDAAVAALRSASATLAGGIQEKGFTCWLNLCSRDRASPARQARTISAHHRELNELGFGLVALENVGDCLAAAEKRDAETAAALHAVGAKEDGAILRNGETLAERLTALHETASDFEQLAQTPGFEWIDGISQSLDDLARALEGRDRIAATTGPIDFSKALQDTECPVAAMAGVIERRQPYVDAFEKWNAAARRLADVAGLVVDRMFPLCGNWADLSDLLRRLAEDEAGARLAADLLRYRRDLEEIGCAPLAEAAMEQQIAGDRLADAFELIVVRAVLEQFLGGNGAELGRLGSLTLEKARSAFVRIDKALQELEAKAIVAARLKDKPPYGRDSGPKSNWTEMALLESELGSKRPRTPIRDITARAGTALQALKPVWMMSPTSAAQYIQPGTLRFDLLVVDEASQMRPEFAVSAIMRGDQFVVVGDANQLPPTDFFSASADEDEEAATTDADGEKMRVDTESILDLANERFRHRRRLKWHYRSQHEGLIQFSNRQFYGRDLIVFPSPTTDDDLLGLKHVFVGGTYEASVNEAEAKAIIEEAFRLMRAYPERSIGIATMNAKQAELIRNEFDRLILEAPEVRRYVDTYAGTIDEFFIKNLENVQGDERDIILISTVYGPDKNGTVMQRFGPMNRDVGWRRLNVLVTRAKLSTRVFTSLRPDDIKVTPTSSKGLIAFKSYLNYAQNGAQYDDASGGAPDSDFEVFVADAIQAAGYQVVPQVGVEGFRIDLGVRHPDFPLGFVAGVECDGATYHTGMTVRDRDRIRQTVLEQMGWNIYRVWSTDWFADPARETAKLLAKLDAWRDEFAQEYARRPPSSLEESEVSAEAIDDSFEEIAEAHVTPAEAAETGAAPQPDAESETKEPSGRPMRSFDGIDWYEVRKGHLYEVWLDDGFAGSVEVLSRAVAAPQVYGGQLRVARSEYEGRVEATGHRFIVHDIHAAVREVARLATVAAHAH